MKKAIPILLAVCLALVPMMALAAGETTITDNSYTWNGQKVTKPVFQGDMAASMNEIIDDTYKEVQYVARRAGASGVVIDYTICYQDDRLLSIAITNSASGDTMADDIIQPYYILFDLTTGKALHYADLFVEGGEEFLLAAFNELVPGKEGWNLEYCDAVAEMPAFDAFYFDGEKIAFVYPAGSVQPVETGTVSFDVTPAFVADYLVEGSAFTAFVPEPLPAEVAPEPVEEPVVRFGIVGGMLGII